MSTENKIIGTVTVSAPFERDGWQYDADVVFDLHEDGQRSLRKQRVELVRGDESYQSQEDFEQEAYALMHAWDTSELEIEVEQLKRENAALREALGDMLGIVRSDPTMDGSERPLGLVDVRRSVPVLMRARSVYAALSPQKAAQAAKEGR